MNLTAELLHQHNKGTIDPKNGPICPYCNKRAILVDETAIYNQHYTDKLFWICADFPKCDAYVGTHGNGTWMNFPLGRLANRNLRDMKTKAHTLFDHIWKTKTLTRGQMYQWFRTTMNLDEPQAHIGELDEEGCSDLIQHLNNLYTNIRIRT
jgi:hypothetical protein